MELKSINTKFVERRLRQAVEDWYSWLAVQSRYADDWMSVPYWCKQVPSRLDIPWAMRDLDKVVGNRGMMRALYVIVDEVYLCCEGVEGVPDISDLRSELFRWHEAEYG